MSLLSELVHTRRRMLWNRQEIVEHQLLQLRALVKHAIKHSAFYRELYAKHGIREEHVPALTVEDLPIINKAMLMEHFDDVVIPKGLTREQLEQWIAKKPKVNDMFDGYKILHSSGTSGEIGFYVYDRHAWNTLKAAVMTYIAIYQETAEDIMEKNRLAYFAATHGLFAGVTLITDAPVFLYNVETFSVLDPFEETLKRVQEFQPNRVAGYASTIAQLAQAQKDGRIHIQPESALVGGDPCTPMIRQLIESAWPHIELTDFYAASESIGIAARRPGEDVYTVFDDLHIVELLNEKNQQVQEGESGQVVLTNLYNWSFPIIRYAMEDVAERGPIVNEHETLRSIHGRVNDALPIATNAGNTDMIHPIVLSEFFVAGVTKMQFISKSPSQVHILFVGDADASDAIQKAFVDILKTKSAEQGVTITTEHVVDIPNNPKTGKFQLVIL